MTSNKQWEEEFDEAFVLQDFAGTPIKHMIRPSALPEAIKAFIRTNFIPKTELAEALETMRKDTRLGHDFMDTEAAAYNDALRDLKAKLGLTS